MRNKFVFCVSQNIFYEESTSIKEDEILNIGLKAYDKGQLTAN